MLSTSVVDALPLFQQPLQLPVNVWDGWPEDTSAGLSSYSHLVSKGLLSPSTSLGSEPWCSHMQWLHGATLPTTLVPCHCLAWCVTNEDRAGLAHGPPLGSQLYAD